MYTIILRADLSKPGSPEAEIFLASLGLTDPAGTFENFEAAGSFLSDRGWVVYPSDPTMYWGVHVGHSLLALIIHEPRRISANRIPIVVKTPT